MAMRQKMSECGWFYHAPQRKQMSAEPVPVPITSQIPGLNDFPPEFEDKPRELYFKDTDTKYIRLAKQGGRKDLLQFREFTPKTAEAKGYPRVDWYYLADNAEEDASNKTDLKWEFLVPEYMAHAPLKARQVETEDAADPWAPHRAPYAFDTTTVFQREGESTTDKTVKIPEARPPGYGVRNLKPLQMKKQPPRVKPVKPSNDSDLHGDRPKRTPPRAQPKEERPDMSLLLSNAYGCEWFSQKNGKKEQCKPLDADCVESSISSSTSSAGRRRRQQPEKSPPKKSVQTTNTKEEKEPFKLSKFKNVPSRVYSHQ